MSLKYDIISLRPEQTLDLRQRVLKPFASREECRNPDDDAPSAHHLGLLHERRLVSVVSFTIEPSPYFDAGNPYRLRGMATDEKYRGQGLGQILCNHSFDFLRRRHCDFIWCNARIKAFSFYERLGFFYHGDLFELKNIGPHKVMYKRLNPR